MLMEAYRNAHEVWIMTGGVPATLTSGRGSHATVPTPCAYDAIPFRASAHGRVCTRC